MDIFSYRWLRCVPLLTLPVWLGCEVGKTVARPTCADLAQGIGGVAGNAPAPGAGSGGTVYGVNVAGMGGFMPTPYLAAPLVQEGMPEDPGPKCLDCTQGRDIEHVIVVDFEDGYAPAWFGFDEQQYPRSPQQTPDNEPQEPPYWGLQVADLAASPARARCGSKYALRLQGGPYSQWGGGVGTSYFRLKGAQKDQYCPALVRDVMTDPSVPQDECGFALVPEYEQVTSGVTQRHLVSTAWGKSVSGFDASQFDGVAFWARRAPGSQTGLQISVEDFNTNDSAAKASQIESLTGDFAPDTQPRLNGRAPACTRAKECCGLTSVETGSRPRCNVVDVTYAAGVTPYGFGYMDSASLAQFPDPRSVQEYRCYVADLDNAPPPIRVAKPSDGTTNPEWEAWNTWQSDFPLCCPTDFEDPQFGKAQIAESSARDRQKACVPYVVEGNLENSGTYYCWDDGDPPIPPADQNRCGDGFRAFVNLSTEWTLFKIPWSELRRSTIGKVALDTTSIWAIAFYWRQGMLDTYVDDFGFYREKQP